MTDKEKYVMLGTLLREKIETMATVSTMLGDLLVGLRVSSSTPPVASNEILHLIDGVESALWQTQEKLMQLYELAGAEFNIMVHDFPGSESEEKN